MTELLTITEVAERLRVSTRTVRRLVASGQIRVIKIGRRTVVKSSEVDAFVAAASRRAA